jgi:hypothetical protein
MVIVLGFALLFALMSDVYILICIFFINGYYFYD